MTKALSVLFISIILMLAISSSSSGFQQDANPQPAKKAQVKLTLTITDKYGRYVSPVGKDQITVLDDKVTLDVTSFEQSDQPMSIGLVFDMSRHNHSRLLASAKAALSNFAGASEKDHRYFVLGFDRDTHLGADWVQSPAEVAAGFDRLAGVKPSRKAALYDALHTALVKADGGPHSKRAIILISDGRNDGSKLKREELFDAVRRSDALVYAVSAKSGDVNLIEPSDYGTLDKLCSISGGFVSSAGTEADFHAFFERLSVELKNQYAVGFTPGSTCPGGGWRRLSFKTRSLELKRDPPSKGLERIPLYVRGREGYYCGR